jgi:hypothetical protein
MNTIIIGGDAPSVFETLMDHQVVAWACSEFHRRTGHAASNARRRQQQPDQRFHMLTL